MTIDRRKALGGLGLLAGYTLSGCGVAGRGLGGAEGTASRDRPMSGADGTARLAALQQRAGGMLGAYVLDTGDGAHFGLNADRRFPHCSSFKLSLAAMLLHRIDRGEIDGDEILPYGPDALMSVSPVTTRHVDEGGLPAIVLARAAVVTSDNAAANLLLRRLGGPAAMTAFWRGIGDGTSRLDAYEPELNRIPPGTEENSTTPAAMAATLARLATGDVLSPASRATLRDWMAATNTGLRRIRAGLPTGFTAGDKTGTSLFPDASAHYIDIAVAETAGHAPVVITAYYDTGAIQSDMDPADEAVLAEVGRIAAAWLSSRMEHSQ
ncbi:class A beta-lactamase [uncultured Croceicoccus sp.]|uniref:class A beta-lactamase n=1 Tax=uncultured Croceicoccus sp. TaxID=1295329 RepID=UPI002633C7F8|nr:class A beta-lactamase [uncultured Croceicoccus sp.]